MHRAAQLLWLVLPLFAANMAPPFVRWWPWRNPPIHERWLGNHKTWVGVGFAVIAASLVCFVQAHIAWRGSLIELAPRWLAVGITCGLAAMTGDALKSLVKRRIGIAPGQPWRPFDQLDFIAAGLLALSVWVALSWADVAFVLGLTWAGSELVNRMAFRWGIKAVPW